MNITCIPLTHTDNNGVECDGLSFTKITTQHEYENMFR